jgi:hypothetical protein
MLYTDEGRCTSEAAAAAAAPAPAPKGKQTLSPKQDPQVMCSMSSYPSVSFLTKSLPLKGIDSSKLEK